MNNTYFLIIIIILGFLAQSRVVILTGFSLLLLIELELERVFGFLANKGIEIGLIFLLLAILSPLLKETLDWKEIKSVLMSWQGIIGIAAGLLATQFNGMGLQLLSEKPHLILGIIIGSLLGILIFDGIPVGPLMAAGIAAVIIYLCEIITGG
ncbi:DUF441 family protein [Iocasia frigidifontis]|uniref:UPF0756 membrane protein GM661_16845 n=1 Tax=Iocasia fonsfrigidae TaxID=2682810 RepID=A0A8A7KKY2_9FIRM|nr:MULTISPECIES: DUF441 family protein [Halanaerobiaceae]AZO93244.1 DUF441 family protein [Halocella sp. SP3-1]QTL99497.1 DUF441 family protein [Iocasia fonsfrigidae]